MKKLIALVLALCLPCLALAQEPLAVANGATLTVTGNAAVTIKADYVRVTVGVSTTAETVEAATLQNSNAIHAVIAALKDAGVLESDIATSNYFVSAEYDYASYDSRLIGYNVTNQLTVVIRDVEHTGATLDKATAAGANSIYNIEFLSTLAGDAQDEATTYAVQDAVRKANLLAQAAGLELGGIISITESADTYYGTPRTYKSAMADGAVNNSILPDDTAVSATVTIVFELR